MFKRLLCTCVNVRNVSIQFVTKRFLNFEIPKHKLELSFNRSRGPGGQNVNKLNTKAEIRFRLDEADWIPNEIKTRFIEQNQNRITKDGEFVLSSEKTRSQHNNLEDCFEKLRDLLETASIVPKERIATKVPGYAHESRLKEKKKHSERKSDRKSWKNSRDYD